MPVSGVTPELVALIPSGYTPLTWDKAGRVIMQMAANKRNGRVLRLERLRVTSRAELHRMRIALGTEVLSRGDSGCLPAETASPDNVLMALARVVRQSQPLRP